MSTFKINISNSQSTVLKNYRFISEGASDISPQVIISKNPEMILSLPELEIQASQKVLVIRELSTTSGFIDILMITESADIILIETKLFRNPESHRAVVAQAIDYIKALTGFEMDQLKGIFLKSDYNDPKLVSNLFAQEQFCIAIKNNIKSGNYKVLIVGDKIHNNILSMVESIHSAPHLAFTLYLVEMRPVCYDDNNILIQPIVIAKTLEMERSVIKLLIDFKKETYDVESTIPQKESKGNRPVLSDEQFLKSLSHPSFGDVIKGFWNDWIELGGDIRFGTVGFSSGLKIGDKRLPIQFVYYNRLALISDSYRNSIGIPDEIYMNYKEKLKKEVPRAYDHLMGNKVEMQFGTISKSELEIMFSATINLAKQSKEI